MTLKNLHVSERKNDSRARNLLFGGNTQVSIYVRVVNFKKLKLNVLTDNFSVEFSKEFADRDPK